MTGTVSCLRCQTTMTEGFLLDLSSNGRHPQTWVEGPPRDGGFWAAGVALDGPRYVVATWRCPSCGYLESRATQRKQD